MPWQFLRCKGIEISEVTLPNSMVPGPGSKSVTIGIWGFKDFEGNPLGILSSPYISIQKKNVVRDASGVDGRVQLYELSSYHPGKYTIEATTQTGSTWDTLTVIVTAGLPARQFPSSVNGKYTDNANEVPTQTTTPSAREVVALLLQDWPGLTQNGARTLAAQFMFETNGGNNCFNWNLGNVKGRENESHMYLRHTWECFSAAQAQSSVAQSPNLAYIPTPEEIQANPGRKCSQTLVIFEPPHWICRFRAYPTLQAGAQRWMAHHRGIAGKMPNYLTAVNAGDIPTVAAILKSDSVKYYSGDEAAYANGMTMRKAEIDRALGAT